MDFRYHYTTRRGERRRDSVTSFGSLKRLRREQHFLATVAQTGVRVHDMHGNLLFRAYYRPYGSEAW